jgi:predicted alpha-1,2-mannosidase
VPFSVFFRMEFSEAMDDRGAWSRYHAMRNDDLGEGIGLACRARVAGEARQVTVSVGISLVSPAGAQRALREELPAVDGRARLDQVIADSTNCWEKLLGRFRVQGGSHDDRVLWNTLWQRIHQIPTRLEPTEVPWFAATETHFNDLVCLWDSSRGANSLLALVDAPHQVSLCRSLIEIGEQTGWIPDAWVMGVPGQIQGGCSAAVLFAEAVRKNLPEFPVDRALAALRHNDETSSPDTGRFGRFPQWQAGDCLPDSVKNHVSRSLEYAFHDRCRSILAQAQGQRDEAQELLQRSERPWQLWHDETQCFGSRSDAGDWNKYDPWRPSCRDFWNDPHFYEGTAQDYTLGAWHLLPGIVERSGGAAAFADRIDAFLERCYHWKEINLHVPWLYHFAGQPQRSSTALRRIADQCVQPGRRGLGDNEDFGAWSSWWLGQAMGLGVIPGSDRYLIAKPRFEQIELDLAGASRPLVIRCVGDGPDIVGMTIDGVAHDDNWLRHGAIADGAEIVLQLGSGRNWGRGMATWE